MTLTTTTTSAVSIAGGLTIRDFVPSEAEYAAMVAIDNLCFPEYPGTVEEWKHEDAVRPARLKFRRWVVERGGTMIAFGSHGQFEGMYHPNKFSMFIVVHPEQQGQGVGAALYRHILAALSPHEPISLRVQVREDNQRGTRFALDRGFREDSRSWESRLDVTGFDFAPFAAAEQRALAAGISFATMAELQQRDPEHRRKLYELDVEATKDEPHPEPQTKPSREAYDGWVFDSPDYLPEGNFIALDGERYIGMSTLKRSQGDLTKLYVGFTGVLREFRGKGVAMALKLKAIAFAREHGIAEIRTWNDALNRPMLRINEALGFAKQPAWISLVNKLRDE